MAEFLAHAVVQMGFRMEDSLYESLKSSVDDLNEINLFELMLVAALPLDMLLIGLFKQHRDRIRPAFKNRLIETAELIIEPEYRGQVDWSALYDQIDEIMAEYGQFMHREADAEGVRRFSMHASERVLGKTDIQAALLIASHFSLTLRHMGDALEEYKIV